MNLVVIFTVTFDTPFSDSFMSSSIFIIFALSFCFGGTFLTVLPFRNDRLSLLNG
jgi:hypothetical protein